MNQNRKSTFNAEKVAVGWAIAYSLAASNGDNAVSSTKIKSLNLEMRRHLFKGQLRNKTIFCNKVALDV